MSHYIIKSKIKIFQLFDEGKRPSDIDGFPVSRTTLYQYYAEWRREKGMAGKRTGFAINKYIHGGKPEIIPDTATPPDSTLVRGEPAPVIKKADRKNLDSFMLDCLTIIDALKRPRPGTIYLPGSRIERFLADILKIKERTTGKVAFLSYPQYIEIFSKWAEIARKAVSRDEFYQLSEAAGIIYEAPGM